MKFSVVIPAHNEAASLRQTVDAMAAALGGAGIDYEIVVVNDHSTDETERVGNAIAESNPRCRLVNNLKVAGYGMAVRCGLEHYTGDGVAVAMADASDDPADAVEYARALEAGYDCAFGTRFWKGSSLPGYPIHKLPLNRAVNGMIRMLFLIRYNDVTNAFKAYRRTTINGLYPLLSRHFNLTVELPLKAIVRGYRYKVIPIRWYGRKHGVSKLRLKEMGSRYLFIILYAWLEKTLSRGDYRRSDAPATRA